MRVGAAEDGPPLAVFTAPFRIASVLDDRAVIGLVGHRFDAARTSRRETDPSDGLSVLLSMLTTDQKGAIAEQAIALAAMELGIGVFRPLAPERYDLIFDLDGRLLRIQCKWGLVNDQVVVVRCYSCRRTADGLLKRVYSSDEGDAFAL
jgi:hypothetical protein